MEHEALMARALALAGQALAAGEVPVACLAYHRPSRQVLAQAHNTTCQSKNATNHCEILCIPRVPSPLRRECVLYVTVEPCIMCAHALQLAGLEAVVFGCRNDRFGGNGSVLDLGGYPRIGGVL
jgi:tRNA-specific adenosine deaminase 2